MTPSKPETETSTMQGRCGLLQGQSKAMMMFIVDAYSLRACSTIKYKEV